MRLALARYDRRGLPFCARWPGDVGVDRKHRTRRWHLSDELILMMAADYAHDDDDVDDDGGVDGGCVDVGDDLSVQFSNSWPRSRRAARSAAAGRGAVVVVGVADLHAGGGCSCGEYHSKVSIRSLPVWLHLILMLTPMATG